MDSWASSGKSLLLNSNPKLHSNQYVPNRPFVESVEGCTSPLNPKMRKLSPEDTGGVGTSSSLMVWIGPVACSLFPVVLSRHGGFGHGAYRYKALSFESLWHAMGPSGAEARRLRRILKQIPSRSLLIVSCLLDLQVEDETADAKIEDIAKRVKGTKAR